MVTGLNNQTGEAVSGWDHLLQSVRDILSTPIGSRVMRRDYGSRLPELLDGPLNRLTIARIIAAVAVALDQWEPRLKLQRVRPYESTQGKLTIDLDIIYDGQPGILAGVI